MTVEITKLPSGQTYQIVGDISSSAANPIITITGDDPTLDVQGILPPEMIAHITPELNTDGSTKAEAFYLGSPVDNGDGTYQYTTILRALKNDIQNNPPVSSDSHGSAGYKVHRSGAAFIVDPTLTERSTYLQYKTNVANRFVQFISFDKATDITVGDGRNFFVVPEKWNGDALSIANAVITGTAGTTGDTTIQIENVTQGYDILSTPITIASGDTTGVGVVDGTKALLTTGDIISVNIDSVSTTAPKGLNTNLETNN